MNYLKYNSLKTKKLIYTFILLSAFGVTTAQKTDSLVRKVSPILCDCIGKIDSHDGLAGLSNSLQKCNDTYKLSKKDSLLIESIGAKEYEYKLFKALNANCCDFKEIFYQVLQQSIEKKKIKQEDIDIPQLKKLIGNSLSDNKKHLNPILETIKVQVTDVKKNNCGYPTHIFVTSNGITFRVSSLFNQAVKANQDYYLLTGKIQDKPDRIFVTDKHLKEPYFFVYSALNLRTLEVITLN
ncbi:MAG: hypothetical protein ACTJGD_06100 [Mesonia hippocampi]|uniref:hypothetical protein n=1 Tax=Mesonia hippocampi TaxID=1628250 RepID=UPI003F9B215E